MKWLQAVLYVALAGPSAMRAQSADRDSPQPKTTPPVLRSSEPSDDAVVMLPGAPVRPKRTVVAPSMPAAIGTPTQPPLPAPDPAPPAPVSVKQPVRREKPLPDGRGSDQGSRGSDPAPQPKIATGLEPRKPPMAGDKEKKAKPALPPGLAKDSADFCQKQIDHWKEADARALLGAPLRQRPALDADKKSVNGRIYAFSDPTGRYKELELDFDKTTGKLRTVFGYPPQLTWKECLRLWGDKVTAADAREGRTFYSFLNRRLDVLVDPKGNVISVGLY